MEVFTQFLTDEQDPVAVGKILPKVNELLTRDEQVEYIAVQKKMVMNLSPAAVVLTNRRFIVVHPTLFGMTFRDVPWREVLDVHMSEQMLGATIMCRTTQGGYLSIDSLPKKQARRVYAYAQQVEESAHENASSWSSTSCVHRPAVWWCMRLQRRAWRLQCQRLRWPARMIRCRC